MVIILLFYYYIVQLYLKMSIDKDVEDIIVIILEYLCRIKKMVLILFLCFKLFISVFNWWKLFIFQILENEGGIKVEIFYLKVLVEGN